MLQRNHVEPRKLALGAMKAPAERAERAESLEALLGIEGSAARVYFEEFAGMIKTGEDEPTTRSRRDSRSISKGGTGGRREIR